jgi:replication-associated recombination protein RarA
MQGWTEKYAPKDLDGFAGLKGPRAVLKAFKGEPYQSAWLFLGPPGTGKTTMALVLAKILSAEMVHVASRECDLEKVEKIAERCHYYPWSGKFWLVLVDEADQMSRAAQVAFLSILDATRFPPNTIFVFTANGTGALEPRFLSRCRVLKFEAADIGHDIPEYLAHVWATEGDREPHPDFPAIGKDAQGNVRDALMRMEIEFLAAGTEFTRAESWKPKEHTRAARKGAGIGRERQERPAGTPTRRFVKPGEVLPAPWQVRGTCKNGRSVYVLATAA